MTNILLTISIFGFIAVGTILAPTGLVSTIIIIALGYAAFNKLC